MAGLLVLTGLAAAAPTAVAHGERECDVPEVAGTCAAPCQPLIDCWPGGVPFAPCGTPVVMENPRCDPPWTHPTGNGQGHGANRGEGHGQGHGNGHDDGDP